MGVPVSQAFTVSSYVLRQRMATRERYSPAFMPEPLLRCNLACAGWGKSNTSSCPQARADGGAVHTLREGVSTPNCQHSRQ